jgi:4-hydroxybenzoate polyprenyltransferase
MFAALRPLHWAKNLLIFAALLLAHRMGDRARLLDAVLAFIAFSLTASGTYLINDLRDAAHDRLHPTKRDRLIASGKLSPSAATVLAVVAVLSGFAIALIVGREVAGWLAGYAVLSLTYSLVFKRRVFLDVLALSALYSIRVLAGGAAAGVEVSDWLLALSGFIFISLALLKRYADLRFLTGIGGDALPGRDYSASDVDLLRSMGVSTGMLAVLVLALYLTSEQVMRLYAHPRLLWLVCPLLLYWIAHMWFLAHRGRIEDDPIVVAAKDSTSYIVAGLIVLVTAAAV